MNYPETPKQQVVDEYHGLKIPDDYRWLEDTQSPQVRDWIAAQNALTREFLDNLPFREQIYNQIKDWYSQISADYYSLIQKGGKLFAMKFQPPKQQPFLVTLASADDLASEATVLDPAVLDPTGGTAIDFFVPSQNGQYVAVSLSEGGSEQGTVFVYEVQSGERLEDEVPRVNNPTAGGSLAWAANSTGFYYTRYPHAGERPEEDLDFFQQVYYHRLGSSTENDTYVIGEEFPRIAETSLDSTDDGRILLATVKNGDGGEVAFYLMGPEKTWNQVSRFEDGCQDASLGEDGYLYLLSRHDSPRGKLIRVPFARPQLSEAQTVVPESAGAIEHFLPTENYLYVVALDGGPSRLVAFDLSGQELGQPPVEPVSSIDQLVRLEGDEILFRTTSFLSPPSWQQYTPETGEVRRTDLFVDSPVDFSDCEVRREFATSYDGTKVPINIILRKGTVRNGKNPLLLNAYGGYGISLTPSYNPVRRVWIDRGGIFAVANLRGGGEYGEEWHRAGNLENKQNVFEDFLACSNYLVERGYTSPEKLCIIGGSNGGLLMGAALTQQPERFKAVVSMVGIYDMLRVELDPNGAFNVTEFGTVQNPRHFEAIYDYSPYHRVVDGTSYPAVLLTTGENDGRVNPAQSRKMAARLQEANSSSNPILLRSNVGTGHGQGTSLEEAIAQNADIYAFLFSQIKG
jgi:prolyl oligopeptidase